MNLTTTLRFVVALVFSVISSLALALPAGKVEFAVGDARVSSKGQERPLKKGDDIQAGATYITGPGARVQLRFADGGFVSMQPETRFRVDQFRYNSKPDGTEKLEMTLELGGVRTITGEIGHGNPDAYVFHTPAADIEVHGTGTTSHTDGKRTSVGVFDGNVTLKNRGGETHLGKGQSADVKDRDSRPQLSFDRPILRPAPEVTKAKHHGNDGGDDDGHRDPPPRVTEIEKKTTLSGIPAALIKAIAEKLGLDIGAVANANSVNQVVALSQQGTSIVGMVDENGMNTAVGDTTTGNRLSFVQVYSAGKDMNGSLYSSRINWKDINDNHYGHYVNWNNVIAKYATSGNKEAIEFKDTNTPLRNNEFLLNRGASPLQPSGVGRDSIISWGKWSGGTNFFTCEGCHVQTNLTPSNNGGTAYVAAAPTVTMPHGKATFSLLGGPSPSSWSSNTAWSGGVLTGGKAIVNFDSAKLDIHLAMQFPNMGTPGNPGVYKIDALGLSIVGNAFPNWGGWPVYIAGNYTTASGGAAGDCVGGCYTELNGFFAGEPSGTPGADGYLPGARRIGLGYMFSSQNAAYYEGLGGNWIGGTAAYSMADYGSGNGGLVSATVASGSGTPTNTYPVKAYFSASQGNALTLLDQYNAAGTSIVQSTSIGSAVASDGGSDPLIAWGRWSGGTIYSSSGNQDVSATNAAAHIVVGQPTVAMPAGNATYTLMGSTTPSASSASAGYSGGSVTSGTLTVNFDTPKLDAALAVNFPNLGGAGVAGAYNLAATNVPITGGTGGAPVVFSGGTVVVTGTGAATGTPSGGALSGFFAGSAAERAGVAYNITRTDSVKIQGVAAFTK